MKKQNRREFLRNAAYMGAGTFLLSNMGCMEGRTTAAGVNMSKKPLRGFIVSDAHIGWENEQQPTLDRQAELIDHIAKRFGDLDVFIDTGDAHHNGKDRDRERGEWTDVIAGIENPIPFYYVPGNHEIAHCGDGDREMTCNEMGSMSCRPYYSFDVKGVHFVSVPELVRAVYINKETLEWLKLDLEVHKDKTTILLSHNNIRGTTEDLGEDGYRGLVNSKEMLELIYEYPNVVAWMHGHNHTYEVVKAHQRLFVSNGRIGGFNPDGWPGEYGAGNLGGIYFEVSEDEFLVKCYSAEKGKFLDELGLNAVFTDSVKGRTTFDPGAAAAYCYGYGGARDGQKMPVFSHHAGAARKSKLYLRGADDAVINDDPEFALFMARKSKRGEHWQLMGSSVSGSNEAYQWMDPGLRINPTKKPTDTTTITVQRRGHHQHTYYRCPTGEKYRMEIDVDAGAGGQSLQGWFWVHDRNGEELGQFKGPKWTLKPGKQTLSFDAEIPNYPSHKTIYSDSGSTNIINLSMEAEFGNLTMPVKVERFAMMFANAGAKTMNPGIRNGYKTFQQKGTLGTSGFAAVDYRPAATEKDTIEVLADGNRRATWLVREEGLDWQVRNAPVQDAGDCLAVGPMRNGFTHKREVVIVPLAGQDEPFVNRMRNVDLAKVYPLNRGNKGLSVDIRKLAAAKGEIEVHSTRSVRKITGADSWRSAGDRVLISVTTPGTIQMDFT